MTDTNNILVPTKLPAWTRLINPLIGLILISSVFPIFWAINEVVLKPQRETAQAREFLKDACVVTPDGTTHKTLVGNNLAGKGYWPPRLVISDTGAKTLHGRVLVLEGSAATAHSARDVKFVKCPDNLPK